MATLSKMAQQIVILRSQRNWTQKELAERIQVSQRTVAAWENGTSVPRRAMQVYIARAFDLPDDYFLSLEQEPPAPAPQPSRQAEVLRKIDRLLSREGISEEKKSMVYDSLSQILGEELQKK